jgi:general stress protein 26
MQTVQLIDYPDIAEAVWTKLAHAANDASCSMRLMAVATVDVSGNPCNRTLVLRGADRDSGRIWFHTDRRSPKIQHLKARPCISALAYDEHDRVQIRLDGHVTLHKDDATAQRHWEQTSMVVRFAYGVSPGPGATLNSAPHPDPRLHAMRAQHARGRLTDGRQNFVVIEAQVEIIDWIQITDVGQRRAMLRAETGWTPQPLVP